MFVVARLIGIVTAALAAMPASAATIGPTWDWQPITKMAREQGISEDMVADILAAGLNLTCDGTDGNGATVNAWLLGSDGVVTTVAHAFYGPYPETFEPFSACYVQSLADILDSIENTNSIPKVYVDPDSIQVGTEDPRNDAIDPPYDRAVFRLTHLLDQMRPLPLPAEPPELSEGQEIFVVSRKPKTVRESADDKEPMMFRTVIEKLIEPWNGLPGGILSDVDDVPGDSGGLYFIRDPANTSRLIPIAIVNGAFEQLLPDGTFAQNLAYQPFYNSAIAILLDEYFYDFP